jgi:Carbohydrate-selective porin, OprB family/S-layer homology domain
MYFYKYALILTGSLGLFGPIAYLRPTLAENPQSISEVAPLQSSTPSMEQITPVSQLTDVKPTDWAFQSLQSLVERYDCITGYPDHEFRGNRTLTRDEFAAGLNACLNRLQVNQVSKEDLSTLQQLQTEYKVELATLHGRVDKLEDWTGKLEATQFSPTTKLTGQVIMATNAGEFGSNRLSDPTGKQIASANPNPTFFYRAALDLDTSFSGQDLLKLRLDALSGIGGQSNAAGALEPNFGSVLDFTVKGTPNGQLGLTRLYYAFNPHKDLKVTLGPSIVDTDFVDLNRYANGIVDFSSLAFVNNYLLFPINGPSAGAVLDWNPGQGPFKLRAVYVAADAGNPTDQGPVFTLSPFTQLLFPTIAGERGLLGSPYQGTIELEYSPSKAISMRLQYSGGKISDRQFDVFGANVEVALSKQLGIFGRYGYGNFGGTSFGDLHPNYWMAGMSFSDLFVPQAIAGIAVGQPFIESAVGNATQTNVEVFYNFPISDNIRITPLIQVITHPSNQDNNGTIITGSLRNIFSF